jgi:hypothetical protein
LKNSFNRYTWQPISTITNTTNKSAIKKRVPTKIQYFRNCNETTGKPFAWVLVAVIGTKFAATLTDTEERVLFRKVDGTIYFRVFFIFFSESSKMRSCYR